MTFAEGYSLTTRQVVLSTAYWLRAFRGGLAFIHDQHPSGGEVLTHYIEQQAAQYTGWLVCEDCSSELEFNRETARSLAARQQNPHDAGPVTSPEAAYPAVLAWTQLYGAAPVLSSFATVTVSVDHEKAAARVLAGVLASPLVKEDRPRKPLVLVGDILTVTIGDQLWMASNLDVSSFRNGDPIPEGRLERCKSPGGHEIERVRVSKTTRPALYRSADTLYNWYAVSDLRGLAPQGWHVATRAERNGRWRRQGAVRARRRILAIRSSLWPTTSRSTRGRAHRSQFGLVMMSTILSDYLTGKTTLLSSQSSFMRDDR
jgi:uncharacterized protein (TIGR02145 family)